MGEKGVGDFIKYIGATQSKRLQLVNYSLSNQVERI